MERLDADPLVGCLAQMRSIWMDTLDKQAAESALWIEFLAFLGSKYSSFSVRFPIAFSCLVISPWVNVAVLACADSCMWVYVYVCGVCVFFGGEGRWSLSCALLERQSLP